MKILNVLAVALVMALGVVGLEAKVPFLTEENHEIVGGGVVATGIAMSIVSEILKRKVEALAKEIEALKEDLDSADESDVEDIENTLAALEARKKKLAIARWTLWGTGAVTAGVGVGVFNLTADVLA